MPSKTRHLAIGVLMTAALVAPAMAQEPAPRPPAAVAGKWIMSIEMEMGTATPALELKQDGAKITGTYTGRYGAFPLTGIVKDRAIEFSFKMTAEGTDVVMSFWGEVAADGQSIVKGRADMAGAGEASWTAKREKTG